MSGRRHFTLPLINPSTISSRSKFLSEPSPDVHRFGRRKVSNNVDYTTNTSKTKHSLQLEAEDEARDHNWLRNTDWRSSVDSKGSHQRGGSYGSRRTSATPSVVDSQKSSNISSLDYSNFVFAADTCLPEPKKILERKRRNAAVNICIPGRPVYLGGGWSMTVHLEKSLDAGKGKSKVSFCRYCTQ